MNTTILHLGSNLGDRKYHLEEACRQLQQRCGRIGLASGLYETAPWGMEDQPPYLNQAVLLHTPLLPLVLLHEMQAIEDQLGRERTIHWGPRTIDIDMLFYNNDIIRSGQLQVPHPNIAVRRFVLVPLAEIVPNWVHPENGQTCNALLEACTDSGTVEPYTG